MSNLINNNQLSTDALNELLDKSIKEFDQNDNPSLRTANQRMIDALNQPEIKPLIPFLWMTNELHLLFADTGIGKSLLAVQICDALSKGLNIFGFDNPDQSYTISLYDFELTDRQFLNRYSDQHGNLHKFSDRFFVDNIDFVALLSQNPTTSIETLIFDKIEADINANNPDILVIDNITFLNGQSTQETQIALQVMRRLNEIKKSSGISILVLAHTPKRSMNSPLTINDLAGSKHLSNFADSVSAIGASALDSKLRYIKQIKPSRSSELVYDSQNVITCEIQKSKQFLGFEFMTYSSEKEHLTERSEKQRKEDKMLVFSLLDQGKGIRETARETGFSYSTVQRWSKELTQLTQDDIGGSMGQMGQNRDE